MNHRQSARWKEVIFGVIAGLSVVVSPAVGQGTDSHGDPGVRMDNRGPGSLNSGPGSLNSGPGSLNSGHDRGGQDRTVAQLGDVRREDRREDRQLDRREDRREDRQMDRRENRREDRQLDRREDRREDRQLDRQEDRRSNVGGELRGLDRADHVAGEHGQQGRDNARAVQMDRPNRSERVERPQRPERPERPQRPERSENPERAGRN